MQGILSRRVIEILDGEILEHDSLSIVFIKDPDLSLSLHEIKNKGVVILSYGVEKFIREIPGIIYYNGIVEIKQETEGRFTLRLK